MSGIVATVHGDRPADGAVLDAMLDRIAHRGGDFRGAWIDGGVALGLHLRATTAEDAMHEQPLQRRRAGAPTIVADARIDNRAQLATRLGVDEGELGSDAALVLRAFERWGEECVAMLEGDFAFAIWDPRDRTLFCARDALGIRPLYYHHAAGTFHCASEMHALFGDRSLAQRLDDDSIALFLVGAYAERHRTLYEGVLALPPGHCLTLARGSLRVRRYWNPDPWREIRCASDDEYAALFHATFSEAIQCRLRARGPVAVVLSGGLDSSSVACRAAELVRAGKGPPGGLVLSHLAFPGLACDEARFSRAVAERCRLPVLDVAPAEHPAILRPDPALQRPDGYFHPTIAMFTPMYSLLRVRGVGVTLDGLGGDDLMGRTAHDVAEHLRGGQLAAAIEAAGLPGRPVSPGAWRALIGGAVDAVIGGRRSRSAADCPPAPPWLRSPVARRAELASRRLESARSARRYPGSASRALHEWITAETGTNPLSLAQNDRFVADQGVEARYPFYDRRLIELLLALPHEQRVRGRVVKPILRRAMRGALPELVRGRTDNATFESYIERELFGTHQAALLALFQSSSLEDRGLIEGSMVRELLTTRTRPLPYLHALIDLIALELWIRAGFGGAIAADCPGADEIHRRS